MCSGTPRGTPLLSVCLKGTDYVLNDLCYYPFNTLFYFLKIDLLQNKLLNKKSFVEFQPALVIQQHNTLCTLSLSIETVSNTVFEL
jgi:hypothetical protein